MNGGAAPDAGAPPLSGTSLETASSLLPDDPLDEGRGRGARDPSEIPAPGWWDILRRVFDRVGEQNVGILAAGSAFYAMLAIFPALGALVTVYALISDPSDVQAMFDTYAGILPGDVAQIFNDQLTSLATRPEQRLGTGLLFGVLFAMFSARRGVDALVRGVTVAYHERETRGLIHMNLLTYGLTIGAIMLIVTTLVLLVGLPTALAYLPTSPVTNAVSRSAGWVLFFLLVMFSIAVLYRVGPPRRPAKWRWLSLGSFVATLLWVLGSAAFSYYVGNFGTYNQTYGTLGAIIVLLLWFYLTAFSIMLGALLNAEMELQTARDTTVGGIQPLGERGAVVADTLGRLPDA